jgi:hypothetical protein
MRKAVDLAVERGCKISFTLHDAIYIEYNIGDEEKILILRDAMRDAFVYYFEDELKEDAAAIRLDPKAWGYPEDKKIVVGDMEIKATKIHIDSRAKRDYDAFSKYFETPYTELL